MFLSLSLLVTLLVSLRTPPPLTHLLMRLLACPLRICLLKFALPTLPDVSDITQRPQL